MADIYTRTPVLNSFEHGHYDIKVPKLLTITEQLASAKKKKAELTEQFETLKEQIKDVEERIKTAPDFGTQIDLIKRVKPPLKELEEKLEKELKEATNAVTQLQEDKNAQDVAQTEWNHERARKNVMANEAIERDERNKLHDSIREYNKLLETYQKAAMWLKHIKSKTQIPDGLDKWTLTEDELAHKTLIDAKKHVDAKKHDFIREYGHYFRGFVLDDIAKDYDAHLASVAARKPRSKSPPPSHEAAAEAQPTYSYNPFSLARSALSHLFGRNGGGRSNKKGKKKTRRPNKKCTRRHSKKKSTRRH